MVVEEPAVEPEFKIELTQEASDAIRKGIIDANLDKKEEDLKEQIDAAIAAEISKLEEENKDVIAKYKELAKMDEWKDKTQDEIYAEAMKASAPADDAKPTPVELDPFIQDEQQNKSASQQDDKGKVELPDDIKEKLAEYELMRADPMFDIYAKARKSGDINFLEVLRKENLLVDVKQFSNEEIYRAELNRLKEVDPSVTDESIADAMDEFSRKSPIEKSMIVSPIRKGLEEAQAERAKLLSANMKVNAPVKEDPEKLMQEFNVAAQSLKGKKFLFTDVSDADVAKASENVRNGILSFKKKDGTVDHDAAARAAFIMTNFRKIVEDARADAFAEGRRAEQKKHGNAKSPIRISASTPEHKGNPDFEFEAIKAKAKAAGMSYREYVQVHGS